MPASNPGFADRLITLLTQAGLRPADLSERAGVSLEVVEDCLKGVLPDAMALYRIAKALDVTMEWLISGEEVIVAKHFMRIQSCPMAVRTSNLELRLQPSWTRSRFET